MQNFQLWQSYKSRLAKLALSKTAVHTYLVFMGNGLSMVVAFLFTIILVRRISVSDFGYFSALLSYLLLLSDISDVGIGNSLSKFIPPLEGNLNKLLGFVKTAFYFQLSVVFILVLLTIVFSKFLANLMFHDVSFSDLLIITSIGILGTVLSNFFIYIFSARQKFSQVAILTVLGGLLRLISLLLLVVISAINLKNIVWIQSLSFILLFIISFWLFGKKFLFIKREAGVLTKLISFSSFIGIARTLTAITSRLDVLMLIALTNSVETGIYSIAAKIVSIYPLFTGSFITVVAPKIATINDKKTMIIFSKKIILVTLLLISSIILFIVFAKIIMIILFGVKSVPSIPVLRLLLFSMIFFVGSIPAVVIAIYYLKKPFILTINSILQIFIVIVSNFILIPIYGMYGASISLIIAYGASFFLTTYLSYILFKNHK